MPSRQVIVDGSNLATEGRSLPSLTQLDQAVREYLAENPADVVTVVVDASFGHRIDPSEVSMFEDAETAGELVSPPAGAIGRGDAFLLRIAEKTGATVLSNDSFQEFHGEHPWLFDDGRLLGGKPVPGVGWIFLPRTPVRGQRSREVVKEAKRKKRADEAPDFTTRESGLDLAAAKSKGRGKKVVRAIARATEEAVEPKAKGRRRRRVAGLPPAEPVNEPLAFITFIAAHPLGSEVMGTVLEFSSHGAFVRANGARCYLPLSAMGDPPPRRAREVVTKGEERTFVVQALDPQRRGIELALPGYAKVAGGPTEETVAAEIFPRAEAPPKRLRREKAEATTVDGSAPVEAETPRPVEVARPGGPQPTGPDAGRAVAGAPPARRSAIKEAAPAAAVDITAAGQETSSAAPVAAERAAPGRAAGGRKAPAAKAPSARATGVKKAPGVQKAGPAEKEAPAKALAARNATTSAGTTPDQATGSGKAATPAQAAGVKKAPGVRVRRAPAAEQAGEDQVGAEQAGAAEVGAAEAVAVRGSAARKAATPAQTTPAKGTGVKKAPAGQRAGRAAKAAPATKAAPAERAAPAEGAPAAKAAPTKKAVPTKKAGSATKAAQTRKAGPTREAGATTKAAGATTKAAPRKKAGPATKTAPAEATRNP